MKRREVRVRIGNAAWIGLVLAIASAPLAAADQAASPQLYAVRVEHVWIPMKDGVRLAADLFMPEGARSEEKFPAIFKYDPYRKDDNVGIQQECDINRYFVRRGYVGACVDIRGTGQSEGHTPNREYSEQELNDGEEIVAWLARQPWSNGSVGMFGKSWSGFNAIQLAMRHPPALKAIITANSTERLYNEDIHYIDGIMHMDGYMFSIDSETSESPSPDFPTDEKTLQVRFDNPPWSLLYLRHQRDDAFWHEQVKALDSIQIPVFLIGGFLDMYRDTIPRYLQQLKIPVKAIVGPWEHHYPHDANPGPEIEWRELGLRWWDQWLKGKDTGIMSEPRLAVYMRHWYPPDPSLTSLRDIPGDWRNEKGWPPQDQKTETLYLRSDHSLGSDLSTRAADDLKYVPSAGVDVSGYTNWEGDLTPDQRPADAFSLMYDSAPVEKETAVLGMPEALLEGSATAPLADWFVRLSDIAPDGRVTLVTLGGLNGAQRESMSEPRDLEAGKVYSLRVPLRFTSWVFPRGHRIRVAVSNAQWPMMWPTPYAMATSLYLGGERPSRFMLPTVPLASGLPPPGFSGVADSDRPPRPHRTEPVQHGWTLRRGEFGDPTTANVDGGTFEVQDDHPELASYSGTKSYEVRLSGRVLTWRGHLDLRSDKTSFHYLFKRELLQDGKLIREKTWEETVPRDHQ